MQQQGMDQSTDKEEIFKQLFTDQAYKSFNSKYMYLSSYVVTFKILNADVEKGYAVGAFFLDIPGAQDYFMIPIILKNNSIQSIMFIYNKEMDIFMPLNEDWIKEILKKIPENAGNIAKPDMRSLNMNNNISQISSLPRYNGMTNFIGKLASLNINVPEAIKGMSKEAKDKVLNFLHDNKKIANHFFTSYELKAIKEAFHVEPESTKVADDTAFKNEKITVVTPRTPLDEVKKEFDKENVVMEDMAFRGYHIKDTRDTENKMIVFTDHLNSLENPTKSGPYEVYLTQGKIIPTLVIQDPILIDAVRNVEHQVDFPSNSYKSYQVIAKNKCLVLFQDGKWAIAKNDNIMSTPTLAESFKDSDLYEYVYGNKIAQIPVNKPFIFLKKMGSSYVTTGPITFKTKVTNDNGDIVGTTEFGDSTVIYTDKYKGSNIYITKDNTIFVPNSFKVIPLKEEVPCKSIMGSMKTILTMMAHRLLERGGKPVTIVRDDKNNYGVETSRPVIKNETIVKVATEYNVNAKEVEAFMDNMEANYLKVSSFVVIPKNETISDFVNKEVKTAAFNMQGMPGMSQGVQMNPPNDESLVQPGTGMQLPGMPGSQMDPAMMQQMQQQPQVPPQEMMQSGMDVANSLGSQDMFDASAIMGLSYLSEMENIFPKYVPNMMKALDNVSRIIITFWINAEAIQEEIGITEYDLLEQKMKTLFNSLSDFLLSLNKKVDIFNINIPK